MKQVVILAEGQTEEAFIKNVVAPYFFAKQVYISVTIVNTKKVKSGPNFKGGVVSYAKFKNDVTKVLQNRSVSLVTCMIDFYGLPSDFPGYKNLPAGTCYHRVEFLERALEADINHPKFLAYMSLHEFESLVFIDPAKVQIAFPGTRQIKQLQSIKAGFGSPEEINEGPATAPSKRIIRLFPDYKKTLHGTLITRELDLADIREQCPHFDLWLTRIERV